MEHQAPDAKEFRIYHQPGQMNVITGRIVRPLVNNSDGPGIHGKIQSTDPSSDMSRATLDVLFEEEVIEYPGDVTRNQYRDKWIFIQ